MNVPPIIHLAFRNFRYYLQRYTVILVTFVVVSAGFMVSLGIMAGMRNSILSKASRYFSGDIVIQAFEITADDPMRANIVNLSLPDIFMKKQMRDFETVSKRNLHLEKEGRLFFNGKYMNQRRIIGVEWGLEESILSDFSFHFGGMPHAGDMDGILISTAVAEALGTSVGDRVLLGVLTVHGQHNTRLFTIRGIFNESSFFGYAPYIHKKALNELIGIDGEYTTEIGIHLKNSIRHRRDASAQEIYDALRMEYEVLHPLMSIDEHERYLDQYQEGDIVFSVTTLDTQVEEITELLESMVLILYAILSILTIIATIGVSNTLSMIVIERRQEIGVFRALGMTQMRVAHLFLSECICIAVSGTVLGLFIGVLVLNFAGNFIDIPDSGASALFLESGNIPWQLSFGSVLVMFALNLFSCMAGSIRAVYKTAKMSPVDALRLE